MVDELRSPDAAGHSERDEALHPYEVLAASSRDIILFIRREDGRIVEANAAAAAAYGYTRSELHELTIQDLRAPETLGATELQLAEADQQGLRFDTIHRRRDGSTFPVEVSSQGATLGQTRLLVSVIKDITERRLAEEALRASEARLRLFVEHAPAAIAMFDREMRYLAASRRFAIDYRLPDHHLQGRSHYEVFPEIPERWREIHRRCLAGAVETCEEDPFPRPDGTVDWVRWELRPWRDARGEIGGIVLLSEIVTARKQAEQRLAAERERLAVTLQSIGDAVIATDQVARITVFNGVAEAITGWTAGEAIGRPLDEVFRIIDEETRQPALSPVERVLREGVVVGLANHTSLIARDGTERPIADSGAPIRSAEGISGVVLVFRDQTEERRAEHALRESEARYRAMVEQTAVGVALVDSRSGRFLQVNRSLAAMLGSSQDELLAGGWGELTHPADLEANRAGVRRMHETGEPYRCEKRYLRRDGSTLWASSTISPVGLPGAVTTQIAIVEDISARKAAEAALLRAEEQFRQAQKLESIGRLAGGVAHDFNNLLTVILSCADMLHEEVAAGSPASLEVIQEIRAAGQRASALTRQLLAFARKQVIAPVPLDLGGVVRGSERLLRRVLGEDVELRVSSRPDLWLVRCDPGQMEQVILNLALNARDAMPHGGVLRIETENVPAGDRHLESDGGAPHGEHVRLTVRDSGAGLSDTVKEHLFEPFFTTKPTGQGTGLGLATVYGIVQQSGGHIHVESGSGRGTTFEVCFPRTLDAPVVAAVKASASSGGNETVLVVEDEAPVREVTVRALRAGGYDVRVASLPQAALELPVAELERLDLLVTDVVMPGLDGRVLAAELRRRHPGLRVLYVSGYPRDVIAERGVLDPGIELLEKPFTGTSLLERVRAILDAG